jgi:hypothetical protein
MRPLGRSHHQKRTSAHTVASELIVTLDQETRWRDLEEVGKPRPPPRKDVWHTWKRTYVPVHRVRVDQVAGAA